MDNLTIVKEKLLNRINQKRMDARSWFADADKLQHQAKEALAEANGLETAMDYLKDVTKI